MSRAKNAITLFMQVKGNRKVNQALKQAEASVGRFGVSVARAGVKGGIAHTTFTRMTTAAKTLGGHVLAASQRLAAFGTIAGGLAAGALGRLTLSLANAASEASEIRSLFEQAFQGDALAPMNASVQELVNTLGLSKSELEQHASLIAVFGTKAGLQGKELAAFGKELLWVGADLTAAFGTSFEEAMTAIKSGLSGEIEPLKRFGIVMTEADLAARAASLGFDKAYASMTVDEKILVRAAFIKEGLGFAAGQALREAKNYGTVMRSLQASTKTWQEMLGGPLLEPVKEIGLALRDAGNEWAPKITQHLQNWLPPADQVGQTMRNLLDQIGRFTGETVNGGLAEGIGAVFGPEAKATYQDIERIFTNLGAILGAVALGFVDVFTPFGDAAAQNSGPLLTQLADGLTTIANHKDQIRDLAAQIGQMLPTIFAVSAAFTGWGKAVTVIGQVNGSITALKAGLGVVQGRAKNIARTAVIKQGVRQGHAAKAAATAANAGAATGALGLLPGKASLGALGSKLASPFKALGAAIKGFNLSSLISGITNGIKVLFTVLRTNPIALVITAIIGFGVALKGMWDNSERLRETLTNAWTHIQAIGTVVFQALGQAVAWFQAEVASPFADWWATTGGPMVGTALGWLGDRFADVLNAIGGVIMWLWNHVAKPAFTWIADVGWPAIVNAGTLAQTALQGPMNLIGGGITGIFEAAKTGKNLVVGFFDGMKRAALEMWEKVKPIIDPVREFFGFGTTSTPAPAPSGPAPKPKPKPKPPNPGANDGNEPVQGVSLGKSLLRSYDLASRITVPPAQLPAAPPTARGKAAGGTEITVNLDTINVHGKASYADSQATARELVDTIERELARRNLIREKVR